MHRDWDDVRREFPALRDWTFLNTATYGQTPARGIDAACEHFARRNRFACSDFLDWFDDADRIRAQASQLVNAAPEDIALLPTASAALSLLLGGMEWAPGDRVVTLHNEFPNNLYYPALLAERHVEFVETSWDGFYDAISDRTRLVALSSVNYTNGFRPPLDEIAQFLRARGVTFYIDGTQSVGALRMDVGAIQPAMMAVNAYKWLMTPNGAGFTYVHPEQRRNLKPNVIGWRSHHGWRDVDQLHHGAPDFKETAEKYEGGMLPFPSLYAMGASLELILELGPERIEQRVLSLASQLREMLRDLGGLLLYDEAPHFESPIVAARWPGVEASNLARQLREKRILVSARHGNLRVSVHFYNGEQDLARLADGLRELLQA